MVAACVPPSISISATCQGAGGCADQALAHSRAIRRRAAVSRVPMTTATRRSWRAWAEAGANSCSRAGPCAGLLAMRPQNRSGASRADHSTK